MSEAVESTRLHTVPRRRSLRRRKGISYILSVVMMTLVISAMATTVLLWGLTEIGESRSTLSSAMKARMERIQQSLVVEDIRIFEGDNTNHTLRIYVRNTGSNQIVIDRVYVNHTSVDTLTPTRLSLGIKNASHIDAWFMNMDFTNSYGKTQLVRVVTSRGVSDVGSWTL